MKGIIFDMDGTMYDSETIYREMWYHLPEEYGCKPCAQLCVDMCGTNGENSRKVVRKYFPQLDPYEFIQRGTQRYKEIVWNKQPQAKPGLFEILEYCKKHQYKMGIASGSLKEIIELNCKRDHIESYFDCIVSGHDVPNGKPAPDIFLEACKQLELDPKDCIVIEDGNNGILAANNAGCLAMMVLDVCEPSEEVKEIAYGIYHSLNEIIPALEKWRNNMKRKCAKEALQYIQDGMIVGLGGGSTIGYLCEYIHEKQLKIQVVTPSYKTALKCKELGITVIPTYLVDHVDVAFDGCDEVDKNCVALKSGGSIHTREKIIGSMSDRYILLVDESKVDDTLEFKYPVVVEIVPDAYLSVKKKLSNLGAKVIDRVYEKKDGMIISDQGNMIVEAYFKKGMDLNELNTTLLTMPGIVDTSLFYGIVSDVIVYTEYGFEYIHKQ